METSDYEALIETRAARFDQIDQLKQIAKLKDIARNLESLSRLADAEAKAHELGPQLVNPK
jgi:hypothetical protein